MTTRKTIIETATEFYKKLYASDTNTPDPVVLNLEDEETADNKTLRFLCSEVEKAVNSQKNGKAPGPDYITNEMIKASITDMKNLRSLTEIYNTILETESVPTQWTKSQ